VRRTGDLDGPGRADNDDRAAFDRSSKGIAASIPATPPQFFTPMPASAATVSSIAGLWRAQIAKLHPSAANCSAIARPMPRVPRLRSCP
jgi:hypothetical protein